MNNLSSLTARVPGGGLNHKYDASFWSHFAGPMPGTASFHASTQSEAIFWDSTSETVSRIDRDETRIGVELGKIVSYANQPEYRSFCPLKPRYGRRTGL
jgi:hypothetical protein